MSRQNKQVRTKATANSVTKQHKAGQKIGRTKTMHTKVKRIDGSTNHIGFNKGKRK